jgi:tetratricopeptide (TPR) repeat protein
MEKKLLPIASVAGLIVTAIAIIYIWRHGAVEPAMIWAGLIFVAGSIVTVVGAQQWLTRVDRHALLRSEEKIQNKDALVIGAFFTLVLLLAYCITGAAAAMLFPARAAAAVLLALTWALASASVGGAFGFLLGHPRRVTEDKDKTERAGLGGLLRTGLDDMVDWLVKGLTTVLLVESGPILIHLDLVGKRMAAGLLGPGASEADINTAAAFATPLIVCFTLLGALATCLVTRTYLTGALSRADRTTTGAFGRVGLDLGEVLVLSNAQHVLTTRNLPPDAEVRQVAQKLSALSLADLHSVREFSMWAKAKLMLEQYDDALKGYEKAVSECDCDPAMLLDYAVALHGAKKPAEALARLRVAHEQLSRGTDADTRRNVYKSLTFELLRQGDNYERVIHLVDEFEAGRSDNPASGGLIVNKACAYGQKFLWLAKQNGILESTAGKPMKVKLPDSQSQWPTQLKEAYDKALAAVIDAIRVDSSWAKPLQRLLQPEDRTQTGLGLEVFERFLDFRTAVGLPPFSEKTPPPPVDTTVIPPKDPTRDIAATKVEDTKTTQGEAAP